MYNEEQYRDRTDIIEQQNNSYNYYNITSTLFEGGEEIFSWITLLP
jgi:hypothetical protein